MGDEELKAKQKSYCREGHGSDIAKEEQLVWGWGGKEAPQTKGCMEGH